MRSLLLNSTQRINLHALIGAQRATVDDMRIYWRIQDRIDLTEEERAAIGFELRDMGNGQRQLVWDQTRILPAQEYPFEEEEIKKMASVVKSYQPGYMITPDRAWLEPLLGQLENGSGPTRQS